MATMHMTLLLTCVLFCLAANNLFLKITYVDIDWCFCFIFIFCLVQVYIHILIIFSQSKKKLTSAVNVQFYFLKRNYL